MATPEEEVRLPDGGDLLPGDAWEINYLKQTMFIRVNECRNNTLYCDVVSEEAWEEPGPAITLKCEHCQPKRKLGTLQKFDPLLYLRRHSAFKEDELAQKAIEQLGDELGIYQAIVVSAKERLLQRRKPGGAAPEDDALERLLRKIEFPGEKR